MSELIEKRDAYHIIKDMVGLVRRDVLMDAYDNLKKLPTIDAVPVVHGEWKPFDLTYGRSIYSCSVCEQATEVPMCMEKPMYVYCPNCGARMDGERMVNP